MSTIRPPHPLMGLTAAAATRHGKERALGPPLADGPGLRLVVPPALDTDALGTFTGEVERPGPLRETAVRKARLGMETTGLPRAVASEGAFGPHPAAPFVAGGLELVVYVDDELEIEVAEGRLSRRTTFGHATAARLDADAMAFLDRVGFPSHAVIVRPNAGDADGAIAKGLRHRDEVAAALAHAAGRSGDGLARIESDLRADRNPARMREIALVARRLAIRLTVLCPGCGAPGYGVVATEPGLPCGDCATPTDRVAREVEGCARCDHREIHPRSDGLTAADPAHCPACNP